MSESNGEQAGAQQSERQPEKFHGQETNKAHNYSVLDFGELHKRHDATALEKIREKLSSYERGQNQKIDAVVVLGGNWEPRAGQSQGVNLSRESRIRAMAAGYMYLDGVTDKIVITGGGTSPEEARSEAAAMRDQMKLIFGPRIPDDVFVLEEEAISTSDSGKQLVNILNKEKFQNVALLTSESHLKRSKRIFKSYGIDVVTGVAAEAELHKRGGKHEIFAEEHMLSPRAKARNRLEKPLNVTGIIDRKDRIGHGFALLARHQPKP